MFFFIHWSKKFFHIPAIKYNWQFSLCKKYCSSVLIWLHVWIFSPQILTIEDCTIFMHGHSRLQWLLYAWMTASSTQSPFFDCTSGLRINVTVQDWRCGDGGQTANSSCSSNGVCAARPWAVSLPLYHQHITYNFIYTLYCVCVQICWYMAMVQYSFLFPLVQKAYKKAGYCQQNVRQR